MDKEKRRQELGKLKELCLVEKLEYLWMYYKVWLLIALFVVAGIYLAITMYHGMKENIVVNVAIVGGAVQDTGTLEDDFKQFAHIKGKYDVVKIRANIPADGGDMTSKTALTTLIGANAVDVMVCPEDIYKEYEAQGGFASIERIESNQYLKGIAGIPYEDIYIGVLVNAQHEDSADRFVEFLKVFS